MTPTDVAARSAELLPLRDQDGDASPYDAPLVFGPDASFSGRQDVSARQVHQQRRVVATHVRWQMADLVTVYADRHRIDVVGVPRIRHQNTSKVLKRGTVGSDGLAVGCENTLLMPLA